MATHENCAFYSTAQFSIFFGNKINGLEANSQKEISEHEENSCLRLTAILQQNTATASQLQFPVVLLHQVHGTIIHRLDSRTDYLALASRSAEGDGLITTLPRTAIAVLTADCLPIIFYDNHSHTLAIIHAGWKGLIQGIIKKTLEALAVYPASLPNYSVVLGPSARRCCYEVGAEFFNHIPPTHHETIQQRNKNFYFDLPTYAQKELLHGGIPSSAVYSASPCTICDPTFYSYRRDGATLTKRQATIAVLHNKI